MSQRARALAEGRRQPRWMVHKYKRRGICANPDCKAKLLTGDRIFWEARATAYCVPCGEARDDGERVAYEYERTMREPAPVAVGADW